MLNAMRFTTFKGRQRKRMHCASASSSDEGSFTLHHIADEGWTLTQSTAKGNLQRFSCPPDIPLILWLFVSFKSKAPLSLVSKCRKNPKEHGENHSHSLRIWVFGKPLHIFNIEQHCHPLVRLCTLTFTRKDCAAEGTKLLRKKRVMKV